MKKMIVLMFCLVLALFLTGCGIEQHRGFVMGTDVYSAQVNDGELKLNLVKVDGQDTWICQEKSDLFAIDSPTDRLDSVEFHITSLKDGSDTVAFVHKTGEGSEERYHLTLKISKLKKAQFMIDSVSFDRARE